MRELGFGVSKMFQGFLKINITVVFGFLDIPKYVLMVTKLLSTQNID
jgi:hypothetical protein